MIYNIKKKSLHPIFHGITGFRSDANVSLLVRLLTQIIIQQPLRIFMHFHITCSTNRQTDKNNMYRPGLPRFTHGITMMERFIVSIKGMSVITLHSITVMQLRATSMMMTCFYLQHTAVTLLYRLLIFQVQHRLSDILLAWMRNSVTMELFHNSQRRKFSFIFSQQ